MESTNPVVAMSDTLSRFTKLVRVFRDVCDTLSSDLPSLSCVIETESLCTAVLKRENKVYLNLDSIQSWADKTGAPRTLVLVWAKIAELLLDTAHHKLIVKAVHDTWSSHESPRAIINDAWMLEHNAASLQWSAYAEECLRRLQKLYESGRNPVLDTRHQCQWQGCTYITHLFSRESNLPIACTHLHLYLLTKQQSRSPRSPSSSFERLASPETFGSDDDKDFRFDLDKLSPSWQVDKLHSAKLKLCLLCERKMELEYCTKHRERVTLFCAHCWAGNNKQCKQLLQVKRPISMTEEGKAKQQVYIDDTIQPMNDTAVVELQIIGDCKIIQPMALPMGLEVTAEWYNNILKSHKLKFEPVLQQLVYDLHYFENMHVIQLSSSTYTLTYA